jgi:hypothetical protein
MKFLLILLTLSSFLLAGDVFSTNEAVEHYKQIDKNYDKSNKVTKKDCDTCGTPAILLPYNGEDIPSAKTFPCSSIKGCLNPLVE